MPRGSEYGYPVVLGTRTSAPDPTIGRRQRLNVVGEIGLGALTCADVRRPQLDDTFMARASRSWPSTALTARRVRSSLEGIRCVYVRSVKPASACPRNSLTALMLSPASSRTLA